MPPCGEGDIIKLGFFTGVIQIEHKVVWHQATLLSLSYTQTQRMSHFLP